jgi:DNA-binding LytR/AlgR family response regulator
VALLAQEPLLFPHLTAVDNVAFGPRSTGASRKQARATAAEWLEEVDAYELASRKPAQKEYIRWITASQGQELRLITIDEICYFRSDNKYTLVVTASQESLIRRPIRELVAELDPSTFWQIHRSTVINVNAIAGVHRDMGGHLRVKLKSRKETLAVSEPYVHRFRSM